MSGSSGNAARRAAPRDDDMLDSIKGEAIAFLKGDSNAPWAILAETVIGCIPIAGQLIDARDILKALVEVSAAPQSPLAWFNMITALIGLIPGGGDAVKRSARSIKSGAMHTDDLLAMIRKVYKGDPEKLLQETLDVGKLRGKLDEIFSNSNLTKHLSAEVQQSIHRIRSNLNQQFAAFQKEIDSWLKKGRKTTAEAGAPTRARVDSPSAAPSSKKGAGSQTGKDHHDPASTNANNTARQRQERFKSLSQKVLGVLGEHMADYHCQEIKGWGKKAAHDIGTINPAKLNDGGHLVQLWPVIARGRGIDAVWKTNSATRPYAIIEAKASYDLTKSLTRLLGEAGDKTESSGGAGGNDSNSRSRTGQRGKSKQTGSNDVRQTNGNVTQMSHEWIRKRLKNALKKSLEDLKVLQKKKRSAYTRHVLFFSIPHAASHAEALILHVAQQRVDVSMHATHQVTREFGDSDIERVVNIRADKYTAERAEKDEKRKWKK